MIFLRIIIFLERLKLLAVRRQTRCATLAQTPGGAEPIGYDDFIAPLGQAQVRERRSRAKAILLPGVLSASSIAAAFAPHAQHVLEQNKTPAQVSGGEEYSLSAKALSPSRAQSAGVEEALDVSSSSADGGTKPPLRLPLADGPLGCAGNSDVTFEAEAGVKVFRTSGAAAPGPLIIDVAKALRDRAAADAEPPGC